MTPLRSLTTLLLLLVTATSFTQNNLEAQDTTKPFSLQQFRQTFWDKLPYRDGWVNDWEGLFTDKEAYTLDSIISRYQQQTTIEIAIVTIDSMCVAKKNFDAFTLHIANTWGVGAKGKANGILIGISRGHRNIRIQNGYGIEKLITDDETKEILFDCFIPGFRSGDYYLGTLEGLIQLIDLINTKL